MVECKENLKKIYRIPVNNFNRKNFMCLNMNENCSGIPEKFLDNCISKIDKKSLSLYPQYYDTINVLAKYNNVNQENIILTNGSDSAIKYIFETYVNSNDNILTVNPTFAMYKIYSEIYEAHSIELEYGDNLSFPKDEFIYHLNNSNIKLAIIVNPNNPTGTVLSNNEIKEIADLCEKKDVLLIIDEAYFYFYDKTFINNIKNYKNIIILRTFSKLCGIAGLRIGYLVADKNITKNIYKVKPTYDVNQVASIFAKEFIEQSNVINDMIQEFKQGKKYLISQLLKNQIPFIEGEANFILIKCDEYTQTIYNDLEKINILTYINSNYKCMKDYIRVTIANEKIMEEFWGVFKNIYFSYKGLDD